MQLFGMAQQQKPLQLSVNSARFQGDSVYTKLEIYQSIGRQGLSYKKSQTGFVANFQLETKIIENDSVIIEQKFVEKDTILNLEHIEPQQQFIYTLPFFLKPGGYEVLSSLIDKNDNREFSKSMHISVKPFSNDSLALSDIQFASKIKKASNTDNPFFKNNLHVMPNPQSLYGDGLNNLTFYAELYNLDFSDGSEGTYRVDYIIENTNGETLHRIQGRPRHKQSKNAAIYTAFDITNLKSNRYKLKLDVIDNTTNKNVSTSKDFYIFRRADAPVLRAEENTDLYQSFDDTTLQNYFDQISFIATEEEKSVFGQLELQGKRQFLSQFWERRDPTPGTSENEFKEDYIERLFKTKVNFSYGDNEGWKTDRGRILLMYGSPDFIDREPGLSDKNAHEIWTYETLPGQQGQGMFIFIDLTDNGNYRLIHSNHRDEISNSEWESYLYK